MLLVRGVWSGEVSLSPAAGLRLRIEGETRDFTGKHENASSFGGAFGHHPNVVWLFENVNQPEAAAAEILTYILS